MPQTASVQHKENLSQSVDPATAETLLDTVHLGQRIRRQRLKRSMGLVELGKLTGLSPSFLSQLETGRVIPTLRNLARLSLVFEKDLSFFFQAPDHGVFRTQRSSDRVRLKMGTPETDYIAESFGILLPEGGMRPCLAEFMAGTNHYFQPDVYPGIEMVYVTEGELELNRNGELHVLRAQDLLYIGGETARVYRALGEKSAKAMIISFDGAGPNPGKLVKRRLSTSGA